MTPTPTPAHQVFREKRAQQFANPAGLAKVPLVVEVQMRHDAEKFLAGMEAEHEVARLMGRIDAVDDIQERVRLQAQLAALLEGK